MCGITGKLMKPFFGGHMSIILLSFKDFFMFNRLQSLGYTKLMVLGSSHLLKKVGLANSNGATNRDAKRTGADGTS